jgi:hypothetical protein
MPARAYRRVFDWVNLVAHSDWSDTATINSGECMSSSDDAVDSESVDSYVKDCDTCSNSVASSLPGNDIFHDIVETNDKLTFQAQKLEYEKMKAIDLRALCAERGCDHGRLKADMAARLANLKVRSERSKHQSLNDVIKIQDEVMQQALQAEYMKLTKAALNQLTDGRGCLRRKTKLDAATHLATQDVGAAQESMEGRHEENKELIRGARQAEYEAMTLATLRDICSQRGCMKDPSKPEIAERLANLDARSYYFKQRRKKAYEDIVE